MPRVELNPIERTEDLWRKSRVMCTRGILEMARDEFADFAKPDDYLRYVQGARTQVEDVDGDFQLAELCGAAPYGWPAEYTTAEQGMILDLGWSNPDAMSSFPNYQTIWSPDAQGVRGWLSKPDAEDVSNLIARTLRSVHGIKSPDNIEFTEGRWGQSNDDGGEMPQPPATEVAPKLGATGLLKGLLKAAAMGLDQNRWSREREQLPPRYVRLAENAYDLHKAAKLTSEKFAVLAGYDVELLRQIAGGTDLPGSSLGETDEMRAVAREAVIWILSRYD
jgi:hypothetical protein